ncbi:MAG: VOC family protein [Mycobacterium sp.]|jgi:predicted enzyme related to lactoylglutathione lyase
MSLSLEMITVDCADPRRLAEWWAEAVSGSVVNLPGGDFVLVAREGWPALGFQRVEEPTPGKNRVHLDLMATDLEADVQRLTGLGATETGRHSFDGGFRWVVMADPEGNAFCVAAPRD